MGEMGRELSTYRTLATCLQDFTTTEQRYVAALTEAGHTIERTVQNESETSIVATSKETTQKKGEHFQNLQDIFSTVQARKKQLEIETLEEIARLKEEYKAKENLENEEAVAKIQQLQASIAREIAAEQTGNLSKVAALNQTHQFALASLESESKKRVARIAAEMSQIQQDFENFKRDIKAEGDKKSAGYRARLKAARHQETEARTSYEAESAKMNARLKAAKAAINFS
jgi:hypothetical protein